MVFYENHIKHLFIVKALLRMFKFLTVRIFWLFNYKIKEGHFLNCDNIQYNILLGMWYAKYRREKLYALLDLNYSCGKLEISRWLVRVNWVEMWNFFINEIAVNK